MGWCPLALPGTAVPGDRRTHHKWESRLGPGCSLAAQDRDRTGTHMALSLLVATGTAWTEWPFHGAVGGEPIGWDPPSPSLPGVGPLLPGSFCCLPRAGKYRHVALGNSSLGARHLGQQGHATCQAPPLCHLRTGTSTLPCSASAPPHFAQFPPLGRCSCIPCTEPSAS